MAEPNEKPRSRALARALRESPLDRVSRGLFVLFWASLSSGALAALFLVMAPESLRRGTSPEAFAGSAPQDGK